MHRAWFAAIAVAWVCPAARLAHAGDPLACPPAVALAGDPAQVAAIGELLAARGIGPADPGCPVTRARISRIAGGKLAIEIAGDAGTAERTADDAVTAATVIESWARADLGFPLLEARPIAVAEPVKPEPAPLEVDVPAPAIAPTTVRGIQLFAAAEGAYASDHTTWAGVSFGACIGLGPVCAAARVHLDGVATAPAAFGNFDRSNKELLLGLDVPIAIGRARLSPGFSAGLGAMHTHVEEMRAGGETGGLRADVHASLAIPFGARWAFEAMASGDLTQATHLETNTDMELPPEPRGILRLAFGVRYGGL